MSAPIADRIAEVLSVHRVNYHHRNIGGETTSTLRYTSCDGCDWMGGWHDEAGWEAHLAAVLTPLVEEAAQEAVDAALAPVGALLPTWTEATCQTDGAPCSWHRVAAECADEVREALRTGRHNAAQLTPPEPREERGNGR